MTRVRNEEGVEVMATESGGDWIALAKQSANILDGVRSHSIYRIKRSDSARTVRQGRYPSGGGCVRIVTYAKVSITILLINSVAR